ncbi:MAG: TonB-dependent hemoglobin/transferrin/lactoferrin family receptor [Sneathiella sp.]
MILKSNKYSMISSLNWKAKMPNSTSIITLAFSCCFILSQASYAQSDSENPAPSKRSPITHTKSETKAQEKNSAPLQKKQGIINLPPVTVTADRKRKNLLETPGNVSTITRDDLDRRMDNVIEEVFRYEPGIEVSKQTSGTDPFSSSGGIQIRGVGGNRTQVLVDGNRTIERITDSTRDIVDSSNVKAVEVVRGPSSVLWGSDALGGTINFVTKDPSDYLLKDQQIGGTASFGYGSLDNSFTESVTGAARLSPKLSALISITRRDAEEIELRNARNGAGSLQECPRNAEATPCNQFDPTDIKSNNLLSKLVWSISEDNQLRLTGEYFTRNTVVDQNSVLGDEVNSLGTLVSEIHSYQHEQDMKRWRLTLDQDWAPDLSWLDRVKWQATYSPQQINRFGNRHRTLTAGGDEERFLRNQYYEEAFYELDLQLESSFDFGTSSHVLTYGLDGDITTTDYDREDITQNLTAGTTTVARAGGFNFADATTTRLDGYIQDEISFFNGRFKITPGARLSTYSIDPKTDADYQIVPGAEPREITESDIQLKLGTIFNVTDTYSVYGQYSQGFKMPTAQQLFQSLDSLPFFALVPNPDLLPETVDSFEVGLRGDFGSSGYFSVNGFFAKYKNFIQNFVDADPLDFGLPLGTTVLTYDNADSLTLYGIEASAALQLPGNFSSRFALSYQKGTLEDGGVETTYNGALPLQAVAALRYINPEYNFDVELISTLQGGANSVEDSTSDFEPKGYAVFDLVGSWTAAPNVTIRAGITNLFDTRYFGAETRGFPINGSDSVKRTNPLELQTAPGRAFKVGLNYTF